MGHFGVEVRGRDEFAVLLGDIIFHLIHNILSGFRGVEVVDERFLVLLVGLASFVEPSTVIVT